MLERLAARLEQLSNLRGEEADVVQDEVCNLQQFLRSIHPSSPRSALQQQHSSRTEPASKPVSAPMLLLQ